MKINPEKFKEINELKMFQNVLHQLSQDAYNRFEMKMRQGYTGWFEADSDNEIYDVLKRGLKHKIDSILRCDVTDRNKYADAMNYLAMLYNLQEEYEEYYNRTPNEDLKIKNFILDMYRNDPVFNCKMYKEQGCCHVDGILCDFPKCSMNEEYINAYNK
ncbi:MAG: hypothetical protein BWY04_01393 [candidate division CPR1 bacterium ADurb.Bin160]|uniref:Uncharacterized protein n=1 Tax=candidate division CPR1 bacterium ADurb.Bin160 TaxID=1852826 RepID=A0A1V5ZK22_9BACT|nr:MAG: hypothetical protein BWY04_01393 [candidate division CPR1 bacterium ADurb.Bin160]